MSSLNDISCCICGRKIPLKDYIEKHHLIPVSNGGKNKEKIFVCIDCGDQIHQLFNNKELRDTYNTIKALREDVRMQKYIKWIRKQKKFGFCHREKKKKK